MAKGRQKHPIGIRLKPADLTTDTLVDDGDIAVDSNDDKLKARLAGSDREVITDDQTQTLENKTIDGTAATGNNTITADADDITYDNSTSGLTATDTQAAIDEVEARVDADEQALADHLSDAVDAHDATAVSYDNSTSGLAAIEVQAAIDEVEGRLDTAETNITTNASNLSDHLADTTDAHDASAISFDNAASGLTATDAQAAIDEVEGRLDTAEGTLSSKPDLTATTDNRMVKTDGSGDIQETGIDIDDSDRISGVNDLIVDDIHIGANTVESQNAQQLILDSASGPIRLTPGYAIQYTDSTISGSNANLPSGDLGGHVQLTNAALVSIDTIDEGTNGQNITLFNQTGNDITLTNGATPGVGEAFIQTGTKKDLVLKDEASINLKFNQADDSWRIVGGTGAEGGAGINYILNPDAEANTDGWATYADAAGDAPVDGTGGSPTTTLTRSESSPLREIASFLLSKDAANRQGEGTSFDLTIDDADKAKVLAVSFDYNTSANYEDGDVRIYLYDITNSQLIELPKRDLLSVESSLNGRYTTFFQSNSDSTSYRLIFHISSTNATAYDIKFDNVKVGPLDAVDSGSFISDYKEFTPTGSYTAGTYTGRYRRVGSYAEIEYTFLFNGSDASGTATFDLPPGITIDLSELLNAQVTGMYGFGTFTDGSSGIYHAIATPASTTSVALRALRDFGQHYYTSITQANLGITFTTGDEINMRLFLPISGWESGTQPTEIITGREISLKATESSESVTTTPADVVWSTTQYDTTGSFDGTTFTCPEKGRYQVKVNALSDATTGERDFILQVLQNNGLISDGDFRDGKGSTSALQRVSVNGVTTLDCEKGDTIKIQKSGNASFNAISLGLMIERVDSSLSSQIQPTETVACRYTSDSGQSMTTGDIIDFEDKVYDTHNAFDGAGTFTAPIAGKYQIDHTVCTNSSGWLATQQQSTALYINTVYTQLLSTIEVETNPTAAYFLTSSGSTIVDLEAGDTVDLRYFHSRGGTIPLRNAASDVVLTITKVGN